MKKIFSIVAALAVLAISFSSCNKKDGNDPEQQGQDTTQVEPAVEALSFQIEVSDITSSSAKVAVTPSKEGVSYFWNIVAAEDLDYYEVADAAAYVDLLLAYYAEEGYTYDDLADNYLIVTAADSYEYTDLDSETEYIAFAFQIDKNLKVLSPIATKSFTTAEFVITGEEALNLSDAQYAWGYYADYNMGLLQLYAVDVDKDSLIFAAALYTGETLDGTYTEDYMYEPYAEYGFYNYYNYLYNADLDLTFKTLSLTATVNTADSSLNFSGNVVANNAIKYTFNATAAKAAAASQEEAAPVRKAFRTVAKKPAKKVIRK